MGHLHALWICTVVNYFEVQVAPILPDFFHAPTKLRLLDLCCPYLLLASRVAISLALSRW